MIHNLPSDNQPNETHYQPQGGVLQASDPSYVEREADKDIRRFLVEENQRLCWILNARQMGKSSLILRTREYLKNKNIACEYIDVSNTGSTERDWYRGVARELLRKFNLLPKYPNFNSWWDSQDPTLSLRLQVFFEEILLKEISAPRTVIFFDEISATLGFDFDLSNFFSMIRSCFQEATFNCLSFVFVGVATPDKFLTDEEVMNIGVTIELTPFRISEVEPLKKGLENKSENTNAVLKQVLLWTGGQPFLTQKLCYLIQKTVDFICKGEEKSIVEKVVKEKIIDNWINQDSPLHLKTIKQSLMKENDSQVKRLKLYQEILEKREIDFDESPVFSPERELLLSGVVVEDHQKLKIYNRIYETIFNLQWLKKQLESINVFASNIKKYKESGFRDESCLLLAANLEKLRIFSRMRRFNDDEQTFLKKSEEFDGKARNCFYDKTLNHDLIVDAIMLWTRGDRSLNEKIFEFASECDFQGDEYNEKEWVNMEVIRSLALGDILNKGEFIQLMSNHLEHLGELRMLSEENAKRLEESIVKLCECEKFNNPLGLIDEVLLLTEGEPNLTEIIVNMIVRDGSLINSEDDCAKVEEVVKTELIENWNKNSVENNSENYFQKIESELLEDIDFLESYQAILSSEPINLGDEELTKAQKKLHELGLIEITQDGQLKIYNSIYKQVFNGSWVQQKIEDWRPYTVKLLAWLKSKNKAYLLNAKEYEIAQTFINEKILSKEEKIFLGRSKASIFVKQKGIMTNSSLSRVRSSRN